MATIAALRDEVFSYLYGAYPTDRPFESILGEALDNSETDIDVLNGADWDRSDIMEISTTGELCLVLSVSTNTVTVVRSYGTVAATAGVTATDIIRKNPRFTMEAIDRSVQSVIKGLQTWGIHWFDTGDITLVATEYYYALSDATWCAPYNVLAVYHPDASTEIPVHLPFHNSGPALSSTPAEWGQKQGITTLSWGTQVAGEKLGYTFAALFADETELTVPMEELVVFGACARMLGRTIAPSTQDPGARTDRTVQPGQTSRDGRWFQGEFFIRARAEAAMLAVQRQGFSRSARTARASRWVG